MRTSVAVLAIAVTGLFAAGCGSRDEHPRPSVSSAISRTPAATSISAHAGDPDQAVGAIFIGDTDIHTCTGAVMHSRTGDVIVTAAHCLMAGSSATFVPKYTDHVDPNNTWTIDAVYLDSRWLNSQDPNADYAFATVHQNAGESLEQSAGAALSLGSTPDHATAIRVIAYPAGDGGPIGCDTTVQQGERGFPTLECGGLVDGTSGAPLIAGTTAIGVIGGLDGGGCQDDVSYAARFDDQTAALFVRAEAGGAGDAPPSTISSTC